MFKRCLQALVGAIAVLGVIAMPIAEARPKKGEAQRSARVSVKKMAQAKKSAVSKNRAWAKKKASRLEVKHARFGKARRIAFAQKPRNFARASAARWQPVAYVPELQSELDGPALVAGVAMAYNERTGQVEFEKNANRPVPIASITKLMTAMVVMDAKLDLDEVVFISDEDVWRSEGSRSRLQVGFGLTRAELIRVAMLVSDNRAAVALGRTFPGGMEQFVALMNRKAEKLGMKQARFVEPSGLSEENVASPADIVRMVQAAYEYPLLRETSATIQTEILPFGAANPITFRNTNQLVRDPEWLIGVSKTGFIREAGHCLVMQATIANIPYVLVVMDSVGNRSREGDAQRLKRWIEHKAGVQTASS